MGKTKLLLTRSAVINANKHGVKGEVIETDSDTARNLIQAGAAVIANGDTEIGEPQIEKKAKK